MMAERRIDAWPSGGAPLQLRVLPVGRQCAVRGLAFHWWGEDAANPAAIFFRLKRGFLARFPGVADFILSTDGRDVDCIPDPDDDTRWRAIYTQQVVPLALSLQGQAVYHGGAVVIADGAAAFLGRSGQGKSTLVAACAARGHAFLSDDCLVLREESQPGNARVMALPNADFIRLWPDSVHGHAAAPGRGRIHPGSPKPRLQADPEALPYCDAPRHIRLAFVLSEPVDDTIDVKQLSPSEATMAWSANAFLLDLKSPQSLRRNLARAGRLAATVPVYRLAYPRRYELLDEVVRRVVEVADVAIP